MRLMTRAWLAAAAAAALLAACGGSDPYVPGSGSPAGAPTTKGTFSAVVVFGDSLSDGGTYSPVFSLAGNGTPPYFGGKFTTNNGPGNMWVENVAGALGLLTTPAVMGWNGTSQKCPAAAVNAALAGTCTNYAQGGAMVTDPNGIGKDAATGAGALTVPIKTQIANHLGSFGSFKASDLILVYGGGNEFLRHFEAFGVAATQIQANAMAGKVTADQANALLLDAQLAAQAKMKQAALELAGYITADIVAKGGKYVAVLTLPDVSLAPRFTPLPASLRGVATGLADTFNLWLREGLTNQPVLWVDIKPFFAAAVATPGSVGLTNVTAAACDVAKIAALTQNFITDGSALACNATPGAPYNTLVTGADAATWMWADGVHPASGGHKALGAEVLKQLKAAGWI